MFHLLAHLADIFKSRKKEKEDKNEPKVENLPPKYVQMIRQNGLKVLDFSSQYSNNESRSYAASNIAGPSSSFPNYGDFVKSFVLRTYGKWWLIAPSAQPKFKRISKSPGHLESNDFVDIAFDVPVIPKVLHILETYNPGSVIRILAHQTANYKEELCDQGGKWVTLWSGPVQKRPAVSQNFAPPLKKTHQPTCLIRLEFNHEHLDYYTEIDAVELAGNIVSVEDETKERPHQLELHKNDTDFTTKLMKQLSINDNDVKSSECVSDNGYFDLLPSEVVHLIFLYLHFDDILRAAATCRLFFRHCYDHVWYKELDLKPYWTKISDNSLQGLHSRCINTVKLNLSWCGPYGAISPRGFSQFLESSCSKLVCLRLSACKFVDDVALQSIAKCCPQLQELNLSSCMCATNQGFFHLKDLRDLTRLNFYRTNINDDALREILWMTSGLQHLNIGACSFINRCDTILVLLKNKCRNLISLDLWRNSSLTSEGLYRLAEGCYLLEELEIGWCSNVLCSTDCIKSFVKSHPKLKKLFMAAIRSIDGNDVLAVADHCADIEQLDILGTSLVGPATIRKLMAKCPRLVFLDLSFCTQLKAGFVRELRAMYPSTSIKKSFTNDRDDHEVVDYGGSGDDDDDDDDNGYDDDDDE